MVSGNVSLYNETNGVPIFPTPTIGMVGLLEPWDRAVGAHFQDDALDVILLGTSSEALGGSHWLALRRGIEAGVPPEVDLAYEKRLHALLGEAAQAGWLASAHDVADGGLAVALAEACLGPEPVGARVALDEAGRPECALFGEGTGRVVVSTGNAEELLAAARRHEVAAQRIGATGGATLEIRSSQGETWIEASLQRLHQIWSRGIESRLALDA